MTRGNSTYCDRRCLANILVKKELLSAPQGDNCTIRVNITSIQYETLFFDTKEMQMNCRIKVNMQWKDSDLGWTNDTYRFPTVVLPFDKIWTPRIVLDNAVETTMEPYTNDVQVRRDGVVEHSVILFTTVTLSINPFGAFVTLILPTGLIMLADLVSFALPFEGGERNSFKVTLVLSFTMFLLILNEHLPNGGNCSPLLHYHFSFCLVCLVLSMLISILLTRLSVDGSILPCRRVKVHPTLDTQTHGGVDEEKDTDVIEKTSGGVISLQAALQKIVKFLESMNKDDKQTDDTMAFSYRLDKILFCIFVFIYISYIIILICITRTDICKVNNLGFWDDSEFDNNNFDYTYNPD
ncbi:5-hydroxytryptamine receptor 3A [Triplophysa tibetana]|uniref:5-hydroxytryptamine receptor 3A n=1 Tax=Triplophysa tibetana TaxID=1572043 RepID=A0A5A9N8E8_9TELE|nr:5-hydroxytryptamine receptor 3A [Triplophysa tibetana]